MTFPSEPITNRFRYAPRPAATLRGNGSVNPVVIDGVTWARPLWLRPGRFLVGREVVIVIVRESGSLLLRLGRLNGTKLVGRDRVGFVDRLRIAADDPIGLLEWYDDEARRAFAAHTGRCAWCRGWLRSDDDLLRGSERGCEARQEAARRYGVGPTRAAEELAALRTAGFVVEVTAAGPVYAPEAPCRQAVTVPDGAAT